MSFRQKIFISYVAIFLIFAFLLYPLVTGMIAMIQERHLFNRTEELLESIQSAPSFEELIKRLEERKLFAFFRISLLEPEENYLYDTHAEVGGYQSEVVLSNPEVEEALEKGKGFEVRYSPIFEQQLAYTAIRFFYQGKEFVLRTAYPNGQIVTLTRELTLTFLIIGIGILLLFSFLSWFIINFFTAPVQKIIQAVKSYQLGEEDHIPEIRLGKEIKPSDEFWQLAETLNSLSRQIQMQIASLTQEKNEKSAILESLVEGVIAVDQTMNVIYMNKMAEVFLGISEKELVGKNFALAKQPQCKELIVEAEEKNQPATMVLKPNRRQKRFLDVISVPRGRNEGAILVLQDKTGLHKVVEMGRDFIANASHELKTPITIIRGFAETLHDHPELSPEVHKEVTQKIVSNCQRMDTLVKTLLTLAAIDEGIPSSRLQDCDLKELIEQTKQTIIAVHPNANISIESKGKPPFRLRVDYDLFLQAILNLLDNAVKYSKPPAKVNVLIEKKKDEFVIQVSDKGKGIPAEDLDRIFERFYSVDKSYSRTLGGSGLGLSIVERIVEKHAGKIEVESTLGQGTIFTVTLPIRGIDLI
ncbi:MAG: ATP-binding protein [Chlamydiales bacterium]